MNETNSQGPQIWTVPVAGDAVTVAYEPSTSGEQRAVFVFAHGAGGHMNDRGMQQTSDVLRAHGIGTVRFNFPYREKNSGQFSRSQVIRTHRPRGFRRDRQRNIGVDRANFSPLGAEIHGYWREPPGPLGARTSFFLLPFRNLPCSEFNVVCAPQTRDLPSINKLEVTGIVNYSFQIPQRLL